MNINLSDNELETTKRNFLKSSLAIFSLIATIVLVAFFFISTFVMEDNSGFFEGDKKNQIDVASEVQKLVNDAKERKEKDPENSTVYIVKSKKEVKELSYKLSDSSSKAKKAEINLKEFESELKKDFKENPKSKLKTTTKIDPKMPQVKVNLSKEELKKLKDNPLMSDDLLETKDSNNKPELVQEIAPNSLIENESVATPVESLDKSTLNDKTKQLTVNTKDAKSKLETVAEPKVAAQDQGVQTKEQSKESTESKKSTVKVEVIDLDKLDENKLENVATWAKKKTQNKSNATIKETVKNAQEKLNYEDKRAIEAQQKLDRDLSILDEAI